jgi:CBS domain-containing protein
MRPNGIDMFKVARSCGRLMGAVTIAATASVSDALRQMVIADSARLLVADGGRVIGLITLWA